MTLKKFIGKKRGAKSRVAEWLGVNVGTVTRWVNGDWKAGETMRKRIAAMIHEKFDLSAKKTGPKQKKIRAVSHR